MSAPSDIVISLLKGSAPEKLAMQAVLANAPDYARRISGRKPGPTEAESIFQALPPGVGRERKLVYGVYLKGEMVGCIDLIRGYPDGATAMLGLLLLSEAHQRKGIGRIAYGLLEGEIGCWAEIEKIRIGIAATNDGVIPYWRKMGFVDTGVRKPYGCGEVETEVLVWEKSSPNPLLDPALLLQQPEHRQLHQQHEAERQRIS